MNEDRHPITLNLDPADTQAWLMACGYRGVPCGMRGATPGFVFSRINEPAYLAMVGETLIWNGKDVVVEGLLREDRS